MTPPRDPAFPEGALTTLRRTWRLLRSGLAGAAAPVIACYVAVQLLCVAVAVTALGGDGHVVNGEIRTYGLSRGILLFTGVTLIALLAAHVAAVVSVVLVAAGLLLGRPVTAGSAARRAARQAPALALGTDGLPLVAVHDLTGSSVMLLACRDAGCTRRDATRVGAYTEIPGPLDLAVGRDGRPRILWAARTAGRPHGELHLTTCRRPRCAPGGAAFWTTR